MNMVSIAEQFNLSFQNFPVDQYKNCGNGVEHIYLLHRQIFYYCPMPSLKVVVFSWLCISSASDEGFEK